MGGTDLETLESELIELLKNSKALKMFKTMYG